ncbi:hypothetical protein WOLCODRAFT_105367 [Wolfiporia cocos MD-104 SS10]|uniref:F-box domain-containing protein n=1 Tax=Wolfiporia cocos (strain MD-104) TaxID=742152 RepID=A0A2H3JR27_WOLCO|nr:hypothetical protein WOLCODRAFT_105367 [Wolfiporia cocos MD-104 SS10]
MLRLTDDILYEIFCLAALDFPKRRYFYQPPLTREYYQPLALSHVCRHWRRTTLMSPMLWGNIYITNHSQIALLHAFLERSQAVSLHVRFHGVDSPAHSNNYFENKAQIVSRHSSRIVTFEAINLSSSLMRIVLLAFTSVTPALQSLTLKSTFPMSISSFGHNHTPRLRELFTKNVIIAKIEYRDLISLRLHKQEMPAPKLLSVLRQCPTLEILEVGVAPTNLPSNITARLQEETHVSLPHLKELELTVYTSDDAIAILPRLHYPDTTTVQLRFDLRSPDIQENISVVELSESLRLIMTRVRNMSLEMFFSSDTSASVQLVSLNPRITVDWTWARTWQDEADTLIGKAGLSTLSLPSIERLTIVGTAFRPSGRSWRAILEPMRTLSTLELNLRDCRIPLLFDILGAELDLDSNVICPNLTHCIISQTPIGPTVFASIEACFTRRARAGIPLKHLDILMSRDCDFPSTIRTALRESVGEVTVKHENDSSLECRSLW